MDSVICILICMFVSMKNTSRVYLDSPVTSLLHHCMFYVAQLLNTRTCFIDRSNPDVAHTHVMFTGDNTEDLQREIAKLIMDKADTVEIDGKWRKILGKLLITPEFGSGNIIVLPIPVNPQTTIHPTPTITPTVGVTTTVTWIGMVIFITPERVIGPNKKNCMLKGTLLFLIFLVNTINFFTISQNVVILGYYYIYLIQGQHCLPLSQCLKSCWSQKCLTEVSGHFLWRFNPFYSE